MATTEQLRAALAALQIDPSDVERQVSDRGPRGKEFDQAAVEHAMLAGLLYRSVATELRVSLAEGTGLTSFVDRYLAASPQSVTVAGEDLAAQADFDAHWLDDRISALLEHEGSVDISRIPTLLGAASAAAEATKVLLEIKRDRDNDEDRDETAVLWVMATDRLEQAYDLAQQAHSGVDIAPSDL